MKYSKLVFSMLKVYALFVIPVSFGVLSTETHAGVYKCVDATGGVTYSQRPCQEDETTAKIISSSGIPTNPGDCRIAQHFMEKTAKQMLSGLSSGDVFNQYGGIDSIPRTSVALINYVYTYQHNPGVTAERITALSVARCKSGSFGPTNCDDFPYNYINSAGGCELAKTGTSGSMQPVQAQYLDGEYQSDSTHSKQTVKQSIQNLNLNNPGVSAQTAPRAVQSTKITCVNETTAKIKTLSKKMRKSGSAAQQDAMRNQKRDLQKQLTNC